jgi:uncharacterized protein YqhQ
MTKEKSSEKKENPAQKESDSADFITGAACDKKTTIGGQALIEGLMMYGPRRIAMAIRKADGSIYVEEIQQGRKMVFFDRVPFIRGGIKFFRQIVTGTGALMKSAELSDPDESSKAKKTVQPDVPEASVSVSPEVADVVLVEAAGEPRAAEDTTMTQMAEDARSAAVPEKIEEKDKEKKSRLDLFLESHMNIMIVFSAILGILFSVTLFILLPQLIIDFIRGLFSAEKTSSTGMNILFNLAEGVLRIVILITYMALVSRIKDIARVWMYHGAEHKTIACYEAGDPLTVENVRKYKKTHPRCGTAFLLIVVVVSILIFSIAGVFIAKLVGGNIWWVNSLLRLALVPLVGGIAYEILRLTGRHEKSAIGRLITKPGMWLQRFTTREPDDSMIEVAIAAMQAVLPEHEGEDAW